MSTSRFEPRRRFTLRLLGLAAAASAAGLLVARAQAQGKWPEKTVRIVAAGPAGGSADIIARLLADQLSKQIGQPVIVEPKAGAGGVLAVNELSLAPRDGQTLLVGVDSLVSEIPHILKLSVTMANEIKPISEVARGGLVLVGNASLPAKTLPELIAYVKSRPGSINYASISAGTRSHVMGLLLNKAAGIDMTHVGYKGSTPALQDVMGGHVALMFDGPATSIPMLKSGRIKAFAVSSPKRMGALPDVPTFAELGYPQIDDIGWVGLWTTSDVPGDIQTRVREATLKVLQQPKVVERFKELGTDVGQPLTSEQLSQSLRMASDKHTANLKTIGFKPE